MFMAATMVCPIIAEQIDIPESMHNLVTYLKNNPEQEIGTQEYWVDNSPRYTIIDFATKQPIQELKSYHYTAQDLNAAPFKKAQTVYQTAHAIFLQEQIAYAKKATILKDFNTAIYLEKNYTKAHKLLSQIPPEIKLQGSFALYLAQKDFGKAQESISALQATNPCNECVEFYKAILDLTRQNAIPQQAKSTQR